MTVQDQKGVFAQKSLLPTVRTTHPKTQALSAGQCTGKASSRPDYARKLLANWHRHTTLLYRNCAESLGRVLLLRWLLKSPDGSGESRLQIPLATGPIMGSRARSQVFRAAWCQSSDERRGNLLLFERLGGGW
ncbi:hypothetical protein BaRGS_00015237 [Batillaria attramentaria]|uniref:Uncharacterized protein n=1 Tax=Batillaria attramentaria TaxID=370345 RepID=A0ABD0L1Z3_9CAEN